MAASGIIVINLSPVDLGQRYEAYSAAVIYFLFLFYLLYCFFLSIIVVLASYLNCNIARMKIAFIFVSP